MDLALDKWDVFEVSKIPVVCLAYLILLHSSLRRCGIFVVVTSLYAMEIYVTPIPHHMHGLIQHLLWMFMSDTLIPLRLVLLVTTIGGTAFPSAASIDYSKNKEIVGAQGKCCLFYKTYAIMDV